jgi:SAM-dependent methyltransferase
MSFEVSAEAYGAFMGRFSVPLAELFADRIGVSPGQTALDVGAGTGALTQVLIARLGPERVAAVEPSQSFLAELRQRLPAVDVRPGQAEALPFEAARFDVVAAQLVVHFMTDPVAGLREMARVARPGGTVAANVWDHAGGSGPLSVFWSAARSVDPDTTDESDLPGAREGSLLGLFGAAGLSDAVQTVLTVEVPHESFDSWWRPFTLGVGPAGGYLRRLDPNAADVLRRRCRDALGDGPGSTRATAWTVIARTSS